MKLMALACVGVEAQCPQTIRSVRTAGRQRGDWNFAMQRRGLFSDSPVNSRDGALGTCRVRVHRRYGHERGVSACGADSLFSGRAGKRHFPQSKLLKTLNGAGDGDRTRDVQLGNLQVS